MILKACLGCGRLIPQNTRGSRCPECQSKKYAGTSLKPGGSGWEWGRLRANILQAQPYCLMCADEGRQTLATTVDHRIPRRDGGGDHPSNLMSLCKPCHDRKHGGGRGHRG